MTITMTLIVRLALLGYVLHITSGCKSKRLLVSTLPNEYSHYQYTAGIYLQEEGRTYNDAPVFKHENLNVYVYMKPLTVRGAHTGGYWAMSPSDPVRAAEDYILLALSTANTPDKVKETWLVWDDQNASNKWVPESSFRIQCVTKTVAMCPYGNIVLTGLHPRHSIHDGRMGLYVFTDLLFQSRPVFYHEETDEYLYFRGNMWLVGAEVGGKQASMFVMDYAYDPEFITNTWVVFNKNYFAPDDGLRVACPNVTEIDADVVYEYEDTLPGEDAASPLAGNSAKREEQPCIAGYCQNEGSCTVGRSATPVCLCRAGYTGDRCQNVVTCPPPPPISNGQAVIPPVSDKADQDYPFLSIVKYRCDNGYHLNSPTDGAMCDGNGRWRMIPKCKTGYFHYTPQAGVLSAMSEPEDAPSKVPSRLPDGVRVGRRRRALRSKR